MTHIRGKVALSLIDQSGKVKRTKTKHNTITELGKMAALTRGVAGLTDYCELYGAAVAKGRETGDKSLIKPAGSTVKIVLTSRQATEFENASFAALADNEILGYATTATAATGTAKEGIRVTARNAQLAQLVASQTRAGMRFSWTGIEGNLNTIGMFIPPLAISHLVDNTDESATPDHTTVTSQFLLTGQASVPADCIAIGSSRNKLLNLNSLTLADFTPGSSNIKPGYAGRSAFYWGDYIITFTPLPGATSQSSSFKQAVTVFNTSTNASYTQLIVSDSFTLAGFTVENNKLYAIGLNSTTFNAYECTVTDSEIQTSLIQNIAFIANPGWLTRVSSPVNHNKYGFVPVQIGDKYYTYCIDAYIEDIRNEINCYLVPDLSVQGPSNNCLAPYVYGSYMYTNMTHHVGGIYLNTLYNIDDAGLYIAPAGQFGNLFSYFDLEETWEIAASDTLQLSYFYELEDMTS